jgi:hypothetical protein
LRDLARPGKAAIFAAVRPGTRRCRGQREHRRAAFDLIDVQPWYSQRKKHYAGIFDRLTRCMNFQDRTAWPTHDYLRGPHRPGCDGPHRPGCHRPMGGACGCGERCGCPSRVSTDTVGRAIAWFREVGLLGLVSPPVHAHMRSVVHADEGNLAAVYVCTVPRQRKPRPSRVYAGQSEIADPTCFCQKHVEPQHAREPGKIKPEADRASRGQPVLPRTGCWPLQAAPKTRSEGLAAAEAILEHAAWLRELSAEHVRHLARPFWSCPRPWPAADVLHALDHDPSGREHRYRDAARYPAALARTRLALWLGPDGQPLRSASQARADQAAASRAEQDARRHHRAALTARAVDASAGPAAAARALLARSSPAAQRAMATTPKQAPGAPGGPRPRPVPGDVLADPAAALAWLRQDLLGRLDADALIRATRHRARSVRGPEHAAAVRAESAPLIARASAAGSARQHEREPADTDAPAPARERALRTCPRYVT